MEEDVRFTLRVPRSIHEALGKRAKRERRSFNATVVMALEQYLANDPSAPKKVPLARVSKPSAELQKALDTILKQKG